MNLDKYLESGVKRADLELLWSAAKGDETLFEEYAQRRATSEPMAYILNNNHFMGLDFYVDDRAYITPRETSFLVQYVIDKIKTNGDLDAQILDVGTGSGAIAISIKKSIPTLRVLACDISSEALEVAKINCERLEAPIELFEGAYVDNYADHIVPKYIIANLPYGDTVSNEYEIDSFCEMSLTEFDFLPRVSVADPRGKTKCFEEVVLSVRAKCWHTTLHFECGRIPERIIRETLPADCEFNYIPIYDDKSNHLYSLVEVEF